MKGFNILPTVENFIAPAFGTPGSSALDVYAQTDLVICEETEMVDLGFRAEFPKEYACLLLPRSGFGSKFGLALANTVGLIDPDYRGSWLAAMWLNGGGTKKYDIESGVIIPALDRNERELVIKRGNAFGQLLFVKTERLLPNIVSELSETERGEGGFGHTDQKA